MALRALLLTVPLVALAPAARADNPVLHVRARLRVDLDAVERVPGGLFVRGSLRDAASDEPVVGRTVAISAEGDHGFWHYAEPTGADGAFRWRVPLPLGTYRLRVVAGGDDDYVPAPPIERTVDVGRRTPTLVLHVPERAPAHAPSLHVVVEGQEDDGNGPPRAFDDSSSDERVDAWLYVAGRRRTGLAFVSGRAESDELGPFGRAGQRIEVRAEVAPDELRNGVSVSRTVLLTSPTTVSLRADGDELAPDGRLHLGGEVRDDDGPVAGARVAIAVENGAELAVVASDAAGRFAATLRGRDLPTPPPGAGGLRAGWTFLEARAHPAEDWRDASVSSSVAVHLVPAPPAAVWPYVLSPALTLAGLALFFAARDRRWRTWIRRRRVRRAAAAPPPAPGLTESRPRLLSSLRGRADHGFTGVVVDAATDRPIAGAALVVRAGADTRVATADAQGRFAVEELPAGRLVVEIAAPGYVGERFARALPHRGELRGARVRLVPVRARIFEAWRRAAAPLLPTTPASETMTPRELHQHVAARSLLPNEPLAALTALVEAAVWSGRVATSDDLAEAERLAATVVASPQ